MIVSGPSVLHPTDNGLWWASGWKRQAAGPVFPFMSSNPGAGLLTSLSNDLWINLQAGSTACGSDDPFTRLVWILNRELSISAHRPCGPFGPNSV